MAITTNDLIEKFGTQDSADDGSTSAVANNAFSVAADIAAWTNDDDAPFAAFVFSGTFASAATANSSVELFARKLNIDGGTDDEPTPSANNLGGYLGSFPLDNATAHTVGIVVKLPNTISSQQYEFYIRNSSGQSLNSSWALQVTPVAYGPHA